MSGSVISECYKCVHRLTVSWEPFCHLVDLFFFFLNAYKHLHVTQAAPYIRCVCVWSHRRIYVKPLRRLTYTINTHVFFCKKKRKKKRHKRTNWESDRARPRKLHAKQAPTNRRAPRWGRGVLTRHTHTHTHTHTKNSSFQMPGRKISGYKDASGSSSCQNTDSGFVLCCLDLTRQNKWETCPPPQKKCIAKRWSEQSFMPICLKTSTRCNLSFSVCVCEWMWVGVCPCLCVCIFLHVSSDDFSSTSKPLCIFCVYPGVCAVYDT